MKTIGIRGTLFSDTLIYFYDLSMFIVGNSGHAPVRLFFTMAEGDTASRPQLWYSFKIPSGKHW